MKTSRAVNSDSLYENIEEVVCRNQTLAFKILDLCIHLDSPKNLPRVKIEQIYREAEKDLIATRIIQMMIINRLYMFKTTEKDMQWLSSKLNFDIKMQHVIAHQETNRKQLK